MNLQKQLICYDPLIEWYYNKFHFIAGYFSKNYKKRISRDLFQARINLEADHYITFCFGIALTITLFFSLSFLFIPQYTLPLMLLVFSLCFFYCSKFPAKKKKAIAREIEKELPITLRAIAVELSISVPFEKCLEDVAMADYGHLSVDFKKIVTEINSGASIPEALEQFSERTDSALVKKCMNQLINVYQKGGKKGAAAALKKTADEQNAIMRARLKEYNGKLMLYSLVFIACSAIIPAFFQAFVIIGSSFLSMPITPAQALLIPVVVFPLVNVSILLMIRSKRP